MRRPPQRPRSHPCRDSFAVAETDGSEGAVALEFGKHHDIPDGYGLSEGTFGIQPVGQLGAVGIQDIGPSFRASVQGDRLPPQ